MAKKLYLVETISVFRMRYVVEAKEESHAADEVIYLLGDSDFQEFSQHHVDECITSTREISKKEYIEIFDKDNDYLKEWNNIQKMKYVHKIDYKK